MSFSSTLLVNLKDKLDKLTDQSVRNDIETEIRKADLDLLDKINKLSAQADSTTSMSLVLLSRDTTERAIVDGAVFPSLSSWSSVIQVTGNMDVPKGAKAVLVEGVITTASVASGTMTKSAVFSDNNVSTPTLKTSHPHLRATIIVPSGTNETISVRSQFILALNSNGQFYTYTLESVNSNSASYSIIIQGYYMGIKD